ncbi:MAG: hypothetical protein IPH13_15345 [Planctomycetes bacterium]|nr:hypothetical protein [Planctomycetota bacterium]MCC7172147.1 hypothetical protein [Planctomycetota bacterium]
MTTVRLDDLRSAYEWVNFAVSEGNAAYVCRDTGAFFLTSDLDPGSTGPLPDDLGTSDRYVGIPDKRDLDLGKTLVFRFVEERMPHRREEVAGYFARRGGYARFNALLRSGGMIAQWDACEEAATDAALRSWCADHGIELLDAG